MKPVAVAIWLATLFLAAVELVLIAGSLDRPSDQWGIRGYEAAMAVTFGSVGGLLAVRRAANPVGWICLLCGLEIGAQGVFVQYAVAAANQAGFASAVFAARWLSSWMWAPAVGSLVGILPLVFPDGQLPSSRWRPAFVLAVAAIVVQPLVIIVNTEPLGLAPASNNPAHYFAAVSPVGLVGYGLLAVSAFVSATSLVDRYRHADTDVRHQVKWVVYALVLVTLGAAVGMSPVPELQVLFIGTAFLAAVAIAVAVMRYQLYQIDTIISRTIVYGGLSALVAGVYTASITLWQRVFVSVTGAESDAAIVFTTLVVVSLFTPAKMALQDAVDRRLKPAAGSPASPDRPTRVTRPADTIDLLRDLSRLRRAGVLSSAEFEAKTADLVGD